MGLKQVELCCSLCSALLSLYFSLNISIGVLSTRFCCLQLITKTVKTAVYYFFADTLFADNKAAYPAWSIKEPGHTGFGWVEPVSSSLIHCGGGYGSHFGLHERENQPQLTVEQHESRHCGVKGHRKDEPCEASEGRELIAVHGHKRARCESAKTC